MKPEIRIFTKEEIEANETAKMQIGLILDKLQADQQLLILAQLCVDVETLYGLNPEFTIAYERARVDGSQG